MKSSIMALAGAVASVSAQYAVAAQYNASVPSSVPWTTSTVTQHTTYTITSCAATVTNCPAKLGKVTTEVVSVYTTYCPVAATETSYPAVPATTEKSYPVYSVTTEKSGASYTVYPVTTPAATYTSAGTVVVPVYPASSVVPPPVSYAPAPPAYSASKPAGVLSTITISTCVPTTYTSVITVAATSTAAGVAGSPAASTYPVAPHYNTTVPFTGAANAQKAGGLLMAVGLVAALL